MANDSQVDPKDYNSLIDYKIRPQDDFYSYVNKKWLDANEIPENRSRFGIFTKTFLENQEKIKSIVVGGTDILERQQFAQFYKSGMNLDKRSTNGIKPINDFLDEIRSINSKEALRETIFKFSKNQLLGLFEISGGPDMKNSNLEVLNLYASGLSLPSPGLRGQNRDYYLEEKYQEIRDLYRDFIVNLFGTLDVDKELAGQYGQIIIDFETEIAKSTYPNNEKRIPEKNYHKFTLEEFNAKCPEFNWSELLKSTTDKDIPYFIVNNPNHFWTLDSLLQKYSVEDWRVILTFHLLRSSANYLTAEIETIVFNFYGKTLGGQKEQFPLPERIIQAMNGPLGELIGKYYIEKYFPESSKELITKMVGYIRSAMEDRINKLEWMGAQTKVKAIEKLHALKAKLAYPDEWRDFSKLTYETTDSYFSIWQKTVRFDKDFKLSNIYNPPREEQWGMSPQTLNAYYNSRRSEIVFPAGFLQFPMFDPSIMEHSELYGAIGVVIGHEISHGFDDQGRKFDKNGNLSEWWNKEDISNFKERANYYKEEYDTFTIEGENLNGTLTLGENIGDVAGTIVSYYGMKKHLETEGFPEMRDNKYTHDELFFLSSARKGNGKATREHTLRMLTIDPHSPQQFRTNGPLSNFPIFHQIWNVKPGDGMFRDKIAKLW